MISLAEYSKIIGKDSTRIRNNVYQNKKLKEALEGHLSYGHTAKGRGRSLYLDEKAVDILDVYYGLDDENKDVLLPVHTSVKTKKKSTSSSYKRKYDESQKKLLKSLETQDALRVEIDNLRTELVSAKDEIIALHSRKLWQRIVN